MRENSFLVDYAYLAEASYGDFSKSTDITKVLTGQDSFAKLIDENYLVLAHYKDHS